MIDRNDSGNNTNTTITMNQSTANMHQRINNITMKDLNEILSEFLASKKLELREINCVCLKIRNTLSAQYQENLE